MSSGTRVPYMEALGFRVHGALSVVVSYKQNAGLLGVINPKQAKTKTPKPKSLIPKALNPQTQYVRLDP